MRTTMRGMYARFIKCLNQMKPKLTKKRKYNIGVPHNIVRAKNMEDTNFDTLWKYTMKKEVYALTELDSF